VIHIGQRKGLGLLASVLNQAIVVTDHAGRLVHQQRIDLLQRLAGKIRGK
jgi:hypothetical protein